MTKRFLSLLIALLFILTAFCVTPLSVCAESADVTDSGAEPIAEENTPPTVTEATEGSALQEPDDQLEVLTPNDYPLINDIQNTESGVQITWDSYKNNQIYRIYYRKAASYSGTWEEKYPDGNWTRLATVRGNSFLHTGVSDAEIGIYTVRCVDSNGDFTSDFNQIGWENCFYAAPRFTSVLFDESGVHLKWNRSWQKHDFYNGEEYRVYRKTADAGWTRLEQTGEDHYTDDTAEIGVTYYYTVRMIDGATTSFLSDYISSSPVSFNSYPYVNNIENVSSGARLSWYRYSGASSYRVYYRTSDGWTRIAQVSGTSYTDTSVKNEANRVYTVRALDADNEFVSDFNSKGWSNTYFAPPVIDSIRNTTDGVNLTWKRSSGAQAYRVYRKTDSGWLRLAQTNSSSFTDTTAVSGVSYTYTLRMITADGERFMSDFLSGKRITYVAAPVITDAVNQSNGVKLTWEPSKGADFYRIYYWTGSGWQRLASKYLTEYVDTSVKNGETREYTIRCLDEDENFVSDYYRNGTINTYYAPPVIQSISGSEDGVTLTWNRAQGAEDYRLYRRTAESSWKLLTQTDESSYLDTTYEKGTVYYYTLRMIKSDGSRFMSDHNSGKKFKWCDTPAFSSLTNAENGVSLRWNAVHGADQYRVYYRNESGWFRMASVRGSAYTDTDVQDGETRVYTIRCVDANGTFLSDFDANGTSHTYCAPAVIKAIDGKDNAYSVKWISTPSSASYQLYRKALGGDDWTMITDRLTENLFIDDSVDENDIYTYALCSLDEHGNTIGSIISHEIYYRNGVPADGTFTIDGTDYCLSEGKLVNGFYLEKGDAYYYRDGIRLDQDWFKAGNDAISYNRTQWLYELMAAVGDIPQISRNDPKAVFDLAVQRGIIDSYIEKEYTLSVERRYAAQTIVNALGYPKRSIGTISDIDKDDSALSTVAYYGYFRLDSKDRIFPNATVTPDEFDSLMSQLRLYRQFSGKTILSFGDSIMHGCGNDYHPLSGVVAEKYNMICYDYSKDGSTMGRYSGKVHIPDQVREAISYHHQPDIILINGGINDMYRGVELGRIKNGYDMSSAEENTFSGGFEKALWMIRNTWEDTPVIYIRVHNTKLGIDSRERTFGERGLAIAEKWSVGGIDLYNGSSMNAEDPYIRDRYTYPNPSHDYNHDSIHPNALGYATFYIPPIEEMIAYTVTD